MCFLLRKIANEQL